MIDVEKFPFYIAPKAIPAIKYKLNIYGKERLKNNQHRAAFEKKVRKRRKKKEYKYRVKH